MKRTKWVLALAVCLGLTSLTWADDARKDNKARPADAKVDAMTKFLMEAAGSNHFEVKMGQFVAQNATQADVKQFARRMAQDHGLATKELTDLCTRKGFNLPDQMNEKERRHFEELILLKGSELDRAYMSHMVKHHEHDVAAFQEQAQNSPDVDVRAFAQKQLPTLKEHLMLARQIAERFEGRRKEK